MMSMKLQITLRSKVKLEEICFVSEYVVMVRFTKDKRNRRRNKKV